MNRSGHWNLPRADRAAETGGGGAAHGGDGILREIEALEPCEGTVLADRRMSRGLGVETGITSAT